MNRDGFTLLVMGFTGDKAIKWKIKYINAFNEMEEKLKTQQLVLQSESNIMLDTDNSEFKNLLRKMNKHLTTLQMLIETWPSAYRTQQEYDGYYKVIMDHIYGMSYDMYIAKKIKFKTVTIEELKFEK